MTIETDYDARMRKQRERDAKFDASQKFSALDDVTLRDLRDAVAVAINKYYVAWRFEKDKLDALVHECSITKTTPPNNHWMPEREARAKYDRAVLLREQMKP